MRRSAAAYRVQPDVVLRDAQGRQHAERDRLAVQVPVVSGGRLDAVADGVAQVEGRADAQVALILRDHRQLVLDTRHDQRDRARRGGPGAPATSSIVAAELAALQQAVLDDLGKTR